jgi:mono/diheme cytochrome c family protein
LPEKSNYSVTIYLFAEGARCLLTSGMGGSETNGRENGFRRIPALDRRVLLLVLLPALCLWAGLAGALALGDTKPWAVPPAQVQKQNPVLADESSLVAGQKIYMKRCAACHGKTGNGDGPDAVDLGIHPAKFSDPKLREESDGALFWKITVGKKPMPDYGHRLSPTDRWSVINFLRTLARK